MQSAVADRVCECVYKRIFQRKGLTLGRRRWRRFRTRPHLHSCLRRYNSTCFRIGAASDAVGATACRVCSNAQVGASGAAPPPSVHAPCTTASLCGFTLFAPRNVDTPLFPVLWRDIYLLGPCIHAISTCRQGLCCPVAQ